MPTKCVRGGGKTGRKNRARTTEKEIASAAKVAAVMQWRLAGWSLADIGANLPRKISAPAVHKIIKAELEKMKAVPVEGMREMELARLDELQKAQWEKAIEGDGWACDRVLAIMDRRARYLGLDAPVRVDDSSEQSQAKASLLEKLEKMGERMAQSPIIDAVALPAPEPSKT